MKVLIQLSILIAKLFTSMQEICIWHWPFSLGVRGKINRDYSNNCM